MLQRAYAAMFAAIVIAGSADLDACGDKFLRVGRSARFRRYAAVHPAVILIYTPANSTPAGMKEFEAVLKRAGHRPVAVGNDANVPLALAGEPYDLVIADYSDAGRIKQDLLASRSKPRLLPILYKPTKALETEAEKEYICLIKPHAMTKYDALAEIDRLMGLRAAAP